MLHLLSLEALNASHCKHHGKPFASPENQSQDTYLDVKVESSSYFILWLL